MIDLIPKDVEEHDTLVVQVESGAQEALDQRNEGEEPLVIARDQLKSKWDAVVAQIEENRVHKEKLMAVITYCQKMKELPPSSKVAVSIRQTLEENLKEVKEELKLAGVFLKRTTISVVGQLVKVTFLFSRII